MKERSGCAQCKETQTNLKRCTACHQVYYCSKECQRKHWPSHKSICQSMQQQQTFFQTCFDANATELETLLQKPHFAKLVNEFCGTFLENVYITPLAICFLNWDWKSMRILLQYNANPMQTCYKQKENTDNDLLSHLSLLGLMATKVKLLQTFPLEESINYLVEHCHCNLNSIEMDFCTIFQLAAFHGNLRFVKACLEQESIASSISLQDVNADGYSALHLTICQSPNTEASTEQFVKLFEYLVSKGASLEQTTKNGASLLMLAIQHNRTHFEELLRNKYGMELDLKKQLHNFLHAQAPLTRQTQETEEMEEIEMKDEDILEKLEVKEWKQQAPSLQLKILQMKLVLSSPTQYEITTMEKQIQQFQKKSIEFKIQMLRWTRKVRDEYLHQISLRCNSDTLHSTTSTVKITQQELFEQIEQITKQILYQQLIQNESSKDEDMIQAIKNYECILKYVSFQVALHPQSKEDCKFEWETSLSISSSFEIDSNLKQQWQQSRELDNSFSELNEPVPLSSSLIYFEVKPFVWNKQSIANVQQSSLFWIVSNSNGMFTNERRLIRLLVCSFKK